MVDFSDGIEYIEIVSLTTLLIVYQKYEILT